MSDPSTTNQQMKDLELRLDLLERENQRLRERLEPLTGPDNPCFNPVEFQRAMRRISLPGIILLALLPIAAVPLLWAMRFSLSSMHIGPVPLFDLAGMGSGKPGIGLGIIAFGGLSVGVIAFGGMAVGLIAIGGGAVGLIAIGGGSFGLIAIGGGACGYIAVGGSAVGHYALGQRVAGHFVLGLNPEAIEFFLRYFPGLRAAVTTAMPVIPLKSASSENL